VFEGYQSNQSYKQEETKNFKPSQSDKKVAIKWIKNVFCNDTFAHHILREIKLLRILRGHKNIVKLKTIMRPQDPKTFNDLFVVVEHCAQNLMKVIEFNEKRMTTKHIQYITYEFMKGINYLHSKGVIHRDLKPLNILVSENWEIKVSDFGSANVKTDKVNHDYVLSNYVTTKYYRAPELYYSYIRDYDGCVDMWAVGCIIAELFTKDIFINADTDIDYIKSLITFMGEPSPKIMKKMNKKYANQIQTLAPTVKRKSLSDLIPNAPPAAIDLMSKLFTYDPEVRLTAKQVLEHPFLESLYDPQGDKSLVEGKNVRYFDFEFEQFTL